ncbi:MAG: hypothetical protein ISS23_03035 [Nanoarchaeota archaeon]|nr:hypothetical protein [Nanoarchaeota archaeon]
MNKSFTFFLVLLIGMLISGCGSTEEGARETGPTETTVGEKILPTETVSVKSKEKAVGENCGEADYSEIELSIAFKEPRPPKAELLYGCMDEHLKDCSPAYFTTTGSIVSRVSIQGKTKYMGASGWCLIKTEYGRIVERRAKMKKYANTFLDCKVLQESINQIIGKKGYGFPTLMLQMETLLTLEQDTTCAGTMKDVALGKIKPVPESEVEVEPEIEEVPKDIIEEEKEEAMKVKGDDNTFREKLLQAGKEYFDFNIKTEDWKKLEEPFNVRAIDSNLPYEKTTKLPIMEYNLGERVIVDYFYIESREELKVRTKEVNGKIVAYDGWGTTTIRWYAFDCNVGRIGIYYYSDSSEPFDKVEFFPGNIKSLITDLISVCKAESEEIRP